MWQSAYACAAARQTCHSDCAAKGEGPRAGAGEREATVTAPWPCVCARKILREADCLPLLSFSIKLVCARKIQQEILLEMHTIILPDILLEIRSYTA